MAFLTRLIKTPKRKIVKRKDKPIEPNYMSLIIDNPIDCPFRRLGEYCNLCENTDVVKGCSLDFVFPVDCPIATTDLFIESRLNYVPTTA